MLELTEEEKMILYDGKYKNMNQKEVGERIKLHDEESDKLLKDLKKRASRKKHYDTFKK